MIATNCVECERPMLVGHMSVGRFRPTECEGCGERMVAEMTRLPGGKTYRESYFVEEILPTLDGVERVDHPDVDHYIYANPENVCFHRVEE